MTRREASSKPKRKTWHDRRCGHGNPPLTRIIYDFIDCGEPGCLDGALRECGFVRVKALVEHIQKRRPHDGVGATINVDDLLVWLQERG